MGSLGIRISQEGVDVKTGLDKQMVLTSKYSIFKGSIQGTGTVSVPRNGTPTTVTIPHGLGYAPMAQAFFSNEVLFGSDVYIPVPAVFFDGSTQFNAVVSSDSTNVYITFTTEDLITTFGNNSSGTTEYGLGDESPARVLLSNTFTAISGDTIDSISFYAKKAFATESIDVSLYRIESGLPTTKFGGGTVSVNDGTMQVWTVSMGGVALTAGHEYGVAIGGFGGNESAGEFNTIIPLDFGSGNEVSCRETTEQSLPASWDHDGYRSTIPPIWATITRADVSINYTYTIFIDRANP